MADVLLAVLVSIVVLTLVAVVFAMWDRKGRREPSSALAPHERRVLAAIERGLRADDPTFVSRFRELTVPASNAGHPSSLPEETER
jgi:hypothetical protein